MTLEHKLYKELVFLLMEFQTIADYLADIFGVKEPGACYGLKLTDSTGHTYRGLVCYRIGEPCESVDKIDAANATGIPKEAGDGITLAVNPSPHVATREYYASRVLICRFDPDDVLGHTNGVVRVRRCVPVYQLDLTSFTSALEFYLAPLTVVEMFPNVNWENLHWWADRTDRSGLILGNQQFRNCGVYRWKGTRLYCGDSYFSNCLFRHVTVNRVAVLGAKFSDCIFYGCDLTFVKDGYREEAFERCVFTRTILRNYQ